MTSGDVLSVTGFTTGGNIQVDDKDYTVVYFGETDSVAGLSDGDKIVQSANTESDRAGDMPLAPGTYYVVVIDNDTITSEYKAIDENTWANWKGGNAEGPTVYKAQEFTVVPVKTSVEGSYAYQGGNSNPTAVELADRTFVYNGGKIPVNFANGDDAIAGKVSWTSVPQGAEEPTWEQIGTTGRYAWMVTSAGEYKATLTGMDEYNTTGTYEVPFTVESIDLNSDEISIAPSTSIVIWPAGNIAKNLITIKGETMTEGAAFDVQLAAFNDNSNDPKVTNLPTAPNSTMYTDPGKYTFRLTAKAGQDDVLGTNVTVDAYVVQNDVVYSYEGKGTLSEDQELEFNPAKGITFSKNAVKAMAGTVNVTDETTVTVTKDGVEVNDFTTPGVYDVKLVTPVDTKEFKYAGELNFKFTVPGKDYTGSKVYASWQGKNVADDEKFEYTGQAVDPTVVVKDAEGELLTEGTDYSVELRDAATGEAVESAVNVGKYQIAVTFNGTWNNKWDDPNITHVIPFEIVKANIVSGEPTAEWFALPADGSAATPDFTLVSDQKTEFPMSDVETSVVYTNEKGERVDADELTVAGTYTADINVLNTSDNFKGGAEVEFVVAETVAFADVDTNAWYAEEVYKAAKNEYVKGMGNKLFFPEAQMTRAQFAQVLYNMAGEPAWAPDTYPTQFSDVTADAWYAKAVSWAVEAGVVKGTSETTFDPEGNITREQIATMLYRYAGNGAEADASVLDEFVDGGEVCDWAETAMAWAVESGYMNGKGANDLQPHANATRAEVAALSVRVQPNPVDKPDVIA